MTIIPHLLSKGEFYEEVVKKDTVYIHHTAGSNRPDWTIDGWERDRTKSGARLPVATSYVVGGIDRGSARDPKFDGLIYKAFDDKYWAHHLGLKAANNIVLNKKSVGIEICNYGPLTKTRDGIFITYVNSQVPTDMVEEYQVPFRGFKYYQKYTAKQIESLKWLLSDISIRHNIDLKKGLLQFVNKGASSLELNNQALSGTPGVWSHSNVRSDKFDVHPQPQLIELIKSL